MTFKGVFVAFGLPPFRTSNSMPYPKLLHSVPPVQPGGIVLSDELSSGFLIENVDNGFECESRQRPVSAEERHLKKQRCNGTCSESGLIVERPIPFKTVITFSNTCQSRLKIENMGWAYEGVQRYCEAGFDPRDMIELMESIPKDLAEIMQEGCSSLKCLTGIDNVRISELHPPVTSDKETMYDQLQDRLWQRREDCGYFRIRWDPVTQRRSYAAVNSFCASLAGFHPEVTDSELVQIFSPGR
jgi:hypothetical protein